MRAACVGHTMCMAYAHLLAHVFAHVCQEPFGPGRFKLHSHIRETFLLSALLICLDMLQFNKVSHEIMSVRRGTCSRGSVQQKYWIRWGCWCL
eukprot:jgi/Botrbrau1/20112/Bobra.0173s0015.1